MTTQPGVYRMFGAGGELLYVGKARNLKKRVASYFLRASGSARIESMVDQIRRIDVTVTRTEDEALLLENNLIKESSPRYNVSLRDDKSYPYLRITDHAYPRIMFHRGSTRGADRFFGPYPSASTVRESLASLQQLFRLRPCSDSFFAHRQRPCLQHQIHRCSAPCVALITPEDYARDIDSAARLLEGRGEELATELGQRMEAASGELDFERAARLRDQIAALRRLQEQRAIAGKLREADVVAVALHPASSCVVVHSVRGGQNLGHRSFFPAHPPDVEAGVLLEGFLGQYYLERKTPPEVLVAEEPPERDWLEQTLSAKAQRRVKIVAARRGGRKQLLQLAQITAQQALGARLTAQASMETRLEELARVLHLDRPPARLECFDISHTAGERTVASCVVFNEEGPFKNAYRKFNIEGIEPGDDYAAMRQAIARRFARVKTGEYPVPDVLFIDGGTGQLRSACEALTELGFEGLTVVAVAKGEGRRPGAETLHIAGQDEPLRLPPDSPALHLIQRIRDEAHRFAIAGHRGRREKAGLGSELNEIEGLGPARRRALLLALGGLQQVRRAGVEDLARVPGIDRRLAERIHAHFH